MSQRMAHNELNYKQKPAGLNSTPFVRQYGILIRNGVLFYAKRSTKQEIYRRIQTKSHRDYDEGEAELL